MNNKERFLWLAGLVLLTFHNLKQTEQIAELETAVSHNTDFEIFNLNRQYFYQTLLKGNED
jgi:hypothetical protein